MARPSKLTDERLALVRQAARLGLSHDDAAAAVGVAPETWRTWRRRGELAVAALGDHPASRLRLPELEQLAKDLGVDPQRLPRRGRGGRVLKSDLAAAVDEKADRFREFLGELESASAAAKLTLLTQLERLVRGGRVITDIDERGNVVQRGIRRRRKVTRYRVMQNEKGAQVMVPVEEVVVEDEVDRAPDRQALLRILAARWPMEFSPRRTLDPAAGQGEDSFAERIVSAARALFGTVTPPSSPPPPEDGPGSGDA